MKITIVDEYGTPLDNKGIKKVTLNALLISAIVVPIFFTYMYYFMLYFSGIKIF